MAIKLSKRFYGNKAIQTNAQQVLSKISYKLREYKDGVNNLSEWCARGLAEQARENLKNSGYNTGHLLGNIEWKQSSSKDYYTVGIANNKDRDKMYYLEYGTGFVGEGTMPDPNGNKGQAHEWAEQAHWEYAIGPKIIYSTKENGKDGWFYEEDGKWKFTSGLRSVAYLYNAYMDFDDKIYKQAVDKSKIKSILK